MTFIDALKQKSRQFGEIITAPQQRLTKDILRLTPSFRGAEESQRRLEEVKQRVQEVRPELLKQPETIQPIQKAEEAYQDLEKTLPKRSARETLSDVGETALMLYTPAKVAQAAKAAPFLKRLLIRAAEGGVGGGAFGGLEAIREKQPLPEAAKTIGQYAVGGAVATPVIGAGFDFIGNALGKGVQAIRARSLLNKAQKEIDVSGTGTPGIEADNFQRLSAYRGGTQALRAPGQKEGQIIPPAMGADFQTAGIQSPQTFLQSLRTKLQQRRGGLSDGLPDQETLQKLPQQIVSEAQLPESQKIIPSTSLYSTGGIKSSTELNGLNEYLRTKNWLSRFMTNFKEQIVNDWERVRQISSDPNLPVDTGQLTPFERRKLYFGRVSARIEQSKNEAQGILTDLINNSKEIGIRDTDLRAAVNEYLIARHAPERNLALGKPRAAGMSNEEAAGALQRIESLPFAGKIKAIAAKVRGINEGVLDILYQDGRPEGVIDKATYDLLRKRYQNHVPLHRIFDESENVAQILSGRGLDVRGSGIFRAKGSERQVADIIENVFANYTQAIQRVEKNIVDNETLRFARQFNQAYPGLKFFEEIKPKAIGKPFSREGFIFERMTDPTVLSLREGGKQVSLKINDPRLAVALKGVSRERLPSYLHWVSSMTRFFAGLATRFNPEFFLPNKIRDLQEAMIYMASQKGIGGKSVGGMIKRDPQSFADIVAWLRGTDSSGARLYEQMRLDGGTTGGLALSTRKQLVDTFQDIEEKIKVGGFKKAGRILIEGIDKWNQLFEDSTRLSVYKSALAQGLSRERAALLAKEASIDFNQFGTKGPIINALYMFSNASIQGAYKTLRALRNPKVAGAVTATIGASVFAVNEWNDKIDPEWRDKVSTWDRVNSLTVALPSAEGKFNYLSIPVSWGLKPIKTAMDYGYDLAAGHTKDIAGAFEGVASAIIDGYNPLGEQNLMGAATPTVLDVPMQIYGNRAWWGGNIKPEGIPFAPSSELYFKSLKDSLLGRGLIGATGKAYEATGGKIDVSPADINYAIQQYIGGAGRFVSKIINTVSSIGRGEMPPTREIPFVSRFLRTKDVEETGTGAQKAKDIKGVLEIQARARIRLQKEAEDEWERLQKIKSDDEYNRAWNAIVAKDSDLARKIKDIAKEKELGLTYNDKLVKQLGVENWERARYLQSYLASLPENQYVTTWQDLTRKKIITEEIKRQIQALMAGQKE